MIVLSPTDPLVTGLAGIAAGIQLGVGGALAAPRVIAATRAANAAAANWWRARRASLRRNAAVAVPAGLSAELLAAIATVVRAELDKAGATPAPAFALPATPVPALPTASEVPAPAPTQAGAVPAQLTDPWIVR